MISAKELNQLIEKAGITRYELTKRMGVRAGSLDRYFTGESRVENMKLKTAMGLAAALQINLKDLLK